MISNFFFCSAIIFQSAFILAQDTIKVNLDEADHLFLKNNFSLMAAALNIKAQNAFVIQAKIYPNPVFITDLNFFDQENNRFFNLGQSGQKAFQFEQLILLGGKRRSQIEIARLNEKVAEIELRQLLQQLKFKLHISLFSSGQLSLLITRYSEQLKLLEALLSSYELQVNKGNIALKEVVRLRSAYLKLNNERAALLKEFFEIQSVLQTILQTQSFVSFEFSEDDISKYIKELSLQHLLENAQSNHPEVQILESNLKLAQFQAQYQRSLAIPDLSLFTAYDQRGGAFVNQFNTGFQVSLPFWNRNQGNIKASEFKIQEMEFKAASFKSELLNDLQNSLLLYNQSVLEYNKTISLFNSDFEITVKAMAENFQKRNVSIIEFLDFFEAYNDVLNEINRSKTQLVFIAEKINLLSGSLIF